MSVWSELQVQFQEQDDKIEKLSAENKVLKKKLNKLIDHVCKISFEMSRKDLKEKLKIAEKMTKSPVLVDEEEPFE